MGRALIIDRVTPAVGVRDDIVMALEAAGWRIVPATFVQDAESCGVPPLGPVNILRTDGAAILPGVWRQYTLRVQSRNEIADYTRITRLKSAGNWCFAAHAPALVCGAGVGFVVACFIARMAGWI